VTEERKLVEVIDYRWYSVLHHFGDLQKCANNYIPLYM